MSVLLVTCADLPAGEEGAEHLDRALAQRGVAARWVAWDDAAVDWDAAGLVAVRATWDYVDRCAEFLAWARSLDQARLLNGAAVFDWNHDKRYLLDLSVPVVPTMLVEGADDVAAALARWGAVVVKPRVGASGIGLRTLVRGADPAAVLAGAGPWIAQPLVETIRTDGELSVFVLDGRAVSRCDKLPARGEVRVHEEYGGITRPGVLDDATRAAAEEAVADSARTTGCRIDYARVDLVRWQGAWVVSEVELIEPGLYLEVDAGVAAHFAALVAGRLCAHRSG